jgi:hypothetical protein
MCSSQTVVPNYISREIPREAPSIGITLDAALANPSHRPSWPGGVARSAGVVGLKDPPFPKRKKDFAINTDICFSEYNADVLDERPVQLNSSK